MMNRNQFVDSHGQPVDWLIGTAKRNPEAFLVLAAGAALLMRGGGATQSRAPDYRRMYDWTESDPGYEGQGADQTATRVKDTARSYASSVSATADRVTRAAGEYASAASDTARAYASNVAGYADDARRVVGSNASRLAGQAANLADQTQSAVRSGAGNVMREQPLAVALLGVAAGAALAAFFPSTKVEERTLRPARDAVVDAAREMGENVLQAASEAGEQLKQRAVERGLTPEGMKTMAKEAADTFTSRVSGTSQAQGGQSSAASSPTGSSVRKNGQEI